MEKKNNARTRFSKPQRQPLSALIVTLYQSFEGILRQFWIVLVYFFISRNEDRSNWFLLIGSIGLAGISFFFGLMRYLNFTYYIEGDALVIRSGLFNVTNVSIPFNKIQAVRLDQPFIHRLLNLYKVKIDTAGTAEKSYEIPALDKDSANYLKNYILDHQEEDVSADDHTVVKKPADYLIYKLRIPDLLMVGLTANHLRTFFLAFGLFFGLLWQVDEMSGIIDWDEIIDYLSEIMTHWFDWIQIMAAIFIGVIIISIITSTVITLFRFYNLSVFKTSNGFRARAGLINRFERFAPFEKIQIFRQFTNPLRRMIGLHALRIKTARSSASANSQQVDLVGAHTPQVNYFLNIIYPEKLDGAHATVYLSQHWYRFYARYTLLFLAIAVGAAYYFEQLYLIPLSFLSAAFVFFFLDAYQRSWKLLIYEDVVELQHGWLQFTIDRIYTYKLQALLINQTPYQVRNDVATLVLSSAAGPIVLPFLTQTDIQQLKTYFLYKIESTHKNWM